MFLLAPFSGRSREVTTVMEPLEGVRLSVDEDDEGEEEEEEEAGLMLDDDRDFSVLMTLLA